MKQQQVKKKDGFVMLPRWIFESKYLSRNEKFFMMILAFHRNGKTKLCFPSIPRICQEAELCERTVKTIRKKLTKDGFISFTPGKGRKNYSQYELNWLDGGNEVIAKIKKDLKQKEVVQKNTPLSSAKEHPLSSAKESKEVVQKNRGNYKELNKINRNNNNKVDVVDFSLSEETTEKLKNYGLSDSKILELVKQCPGSDKAKYFSNWIYFIERKPPKDNPGGFLIRMIEKKQFAPGVVIPLSEQPFNRDDGEIG